MKSCFLYCTSFIILFFCFAQPISARIVFEDHFDEQDLSGWKVVQNFQWMDQSQPCMNGATPAAWQLYVQQLGIRIFGPGCFTEITPLAFQIPPNRSYTFEFDMTLPESIDMDRNYTLRYLDSRNAYAMKVLGQRIFLEKLVDGQGWGVNGSNGLYPFQPNETYHIKNEVNVDHTMRLYVNNSLILSYEDTAPFLTGGTIGFRASVGAIPNSITWFDNAKVELTNTAPPLPVPYVSQRDPEWKSTLYNHTEQTIEKLGCALSSAVMVLKYYRISEISPGITITPQSLNTWLNTQKDGYIGSGLINWIALTRLSHLFHVSNTETPSLEYQRKSVTEANIQAEFDHNRPLIAELPGHFVVGNLYDFGELSILDPYYSNKHSTPLSSLQSLRTFTPSFTDLRYLQIIGPSTVSFSVTNGTATWKSTLEHSLQPEESAIDEDQSVTMLEIPKPESTSYTLHVESKSPQENDIIVRRYNDQAETQEVLLHVISDQHGTEYSVPFTQSNSESITRIIHNSTLSHSLDTLWELHHFQSPDFYVALQLVAQKISLSQTFNEKQKLLNVIKYYLETYPEDITKEGKEEVLQIAEQL